MKTSRCLVQQVLSLAGGLLFCLPAAFAAPGGGGVGFGTAAASGGGHAAAAPAAHSSGASAGFSHASIGVSRAAFGTSAGLRSPVGTANAFRPGPGIVPRTTRNLLPMPTVNNAWTDPVSPRVAGTGLAANVRTGNHLYPGAAGYAANRAANGNYRHGDNNGDGSRDRHRYFYNNFPYAVYYPYLYNNFGYDGGYGYGGVADYAGLSTDNTDNVLGAPDFQNTPNNYYSYVAPDQGAGNSAAGQPAPAQSLPDAPAVGPQAPGSADKSTDHQQQGPDSLVEAVQSELVRRGYFEGQPDSMYSPATREAIRRFQSDQHLPATGRINEATLHALKLD